MHSPEIVREARLLHEQGLGARRVARRLGLPVSTVRDWNAGKAPRPRAPFDAGELGASYAYLLGLYLGDGTISAHPRGVYRLRVSLDRKYPAIVEECAASMRATLPRSRTHVLLTASNCCVVSAYSKSLPSMFPQHGPGAKHTRPIFLSDWQRELGETWPNALIKGLIHSDGCRFASAGRDRGNPRYSFTNRSTDIASIFCSACDCLGLHWTAAFPASGTEAITIYVSRKIDVAKLDGFVGPKR